MSASIAATAERLKGMRRPPLLSVYSKVVTDVGATVLTREGRRPVVRPLRLGRAPLAELSVLLTPRFHRRRWPPSATTRPTREGRQGTRRGAIEPSTRRRLDPRFGDGSGLVLVGAWSSP